MAKQEPMTQEPTSTQEEDELSGPTAAAPGPGAPGPGVSGPGVSGPGVSGHGAPGPGAPGHGVSGHGAGGRGVAGWFGGLSRGRKLALTWSASVLAVVIALLAIGATSGGAPSHAPPPRAQAFTLAALGHPGQHISLAQYAGHPLILNFFASWCEPCQRETPLMARFYRSHRRGVIIVGVDVNDTSSAGLAFARKMGVAYPVASDPAPMAMALSYGVTALPQTFFLNAQHRIVKRVIRAVTLTDLHAGVATMTRPSGRG